jgi:hypothetical protein
MRIPMSQSLASSQPTSAVHYRLGRAQASARASAKPENGSPMNHPKARGPPARSWREPTSSLPSLSHPQSRRPRAEGGEELLELGKGGFALTLLLGCPGVMRGGAHAPGGHGGSRRLGPRWRAVEFPHVFRGLSVLNPICKCLKKLDLIRKMSDN